MNIKIATRLWTGTSGLVLPVPNKQAFPEAFRQRPRLTYYASLFNSLEVNSSFYKIPMPETFSRWAREVGPHFRFTVKLWRGITHLPGLNFDQREVRRFFLAADRLEDKKGCLLIQLPPGLPVAASGQLDRLLTTIDRFDPDHAWKRSVEFRNRSWYIPGIDSILSQHQASRVLHDMPNSSVSELREADRQIPFVYIRFHGPKGDYKGGYAKTLLTAWAGKIDAWLKQEKQVYVYFNNTIGDALADLSCLQSLLPLL